MLNQSLAIAIVLSLLIFGNLSAQCNNCTVTINGNAAPSASINNNAVVCISGNRTSAINFNNSTGIRICIAENATVNAAFNSLSGLQEINNFGSLSVGSDYNGNWTINNFGHLTFSAPFNSGKTIVNSGTMNVPGSISINGNLQSSGNLTVGGAVTFNGSANVILGGNTSIGGSVSVNSAVGIAGSLTVGGAVHINGSGSFFAENANQCNSITVSGGFTSDGIITGNHLDYGGTGNAIFVNKMPDGNANPKLRDGAVVGTCQTIDCVEVVESVMTNNSLERVFIFRCSDDFTMPEVLEDEEIIDVMALVVGGGGGGGRGSSAGGGGAGAVVFQDGLSLTSGQTYRITVGSGGAGSSNVNQQGQNGQASSILNLVAQGGGGGGSSSTNAQTGRDGASSGGGAFTSAGNSGQAINGNRGGNGSRSGNSQNRVGGGGGGAGGVGSNGSTQGNGFNPGSGGNGVNSIILEGIEETIFFNGFGGGGGATGQNSGGQFSNSNGGQAGSIIIGGNGRAANDNSVGGHGRANSGSGGGAGRGRGGSGASGVVIIRISFRILPVEMLEFKARLIEAEQKVVLNWSTAKEWNNSHFEIERSVDNITNFQTIGEENGSGWSEELINYQFEDIQLPSSGKLAYYRIKQVDFDGSFQYSPVVSVRLSEIKSVSGVWKAYPNPIQDNQLRLKLVDYNSYSGEEIEVKLVQLSSASHSKTFRSKAELNAWLLEKVVSLPIGLNILEIKWGDKVEHIKLIKRN